MTHAVAWRHATALVQAGSQIPATGMFGHLVQTATLPGSWRWPNLVLDRPGDVVRLEFGEPDFPPPMGRTPLRLRSIRGW